MNWAWLILEKLVIVTAWAGLVIALLFLGVAIHGFFVVVVKVKK